MAAKKEPAGFYKGYSVKYLRDNPQHPDYYLVAEYDSKVEKGKIKEPVAEEAEVEEAEVEEAPAEIEETEDEG